MDIEVYCDELGIEAFTRKDWLRVIIVWNYLVFGKKRNPEA